MRSRISGASSAGVAVASLGSRPASSIPTAEQIWPGVQ